MSSVLINSGRLIYRSTVEKGLTKRLAEISLKDHKGLPLKERIKDNFHSDIWRHRYTYSMCSAEEKFPKLYGLLMKAKLPKPYCT